MNSQKETEAEVEDRLLEVQVNSNSPVVINNHENSVDKDSLRTEVVRLQTYNGKNSELEGPILVNARNEDLYSRKQRKKSHLVIYATTFIMSIGFSIVITGVWPYLQMMLDPSSSKQFLGWAIAVNPLGQMIASPLLGWYGVKRGSNRPSFIITIIMFIGGNVLYAILPLFRSNSKYVMLVARFITGISSANIAVCRSYISSSTLQKERTMALSITAASQSMGFILGPSIQTAITYIHPFKSPNSNSSYVEDDCITSSFSDDEDSHLGLFNMYSLAGWFTAVLGFLNFILYLPCVYKEFNIASSEEIKEALVENDTTSRIKTDYVAIVFLVISYFFILLIYVIVETLIVPMCLDLYAWSFEFSVKVVGIGLTVIGMIAFCMFILAGRLSKFFNDRKVFILCGLLPLALSLLIFLPMHGDTPKINYCNSTSVAHNNDFEDYQDSNITLRVRRAAVASNECGCGCPYTQEWCFYTPIIQISQLIVASCVMTIGYPVSVSLAGAIFSKMLHSKDQGLWMGLLTSAGSLSRFIGPIFVSYLYTAKGPLWTFGTLFSLLVLVLIQNSIFYKRLAPLDTLNLSTSNIT